MKKILSLVAISVLVCLMMAGADFRFSKASSGKQKRKCLGYTIIEAGKGIDCNGDTVKLVRKHGYVEFASLNDSGVRSNFR